MTTDADCLLDKLTAAVVVGPHDKLVLAFDHITEEHAGRLRDAANRAGLAGRFVIVSGGQLGVLRGSDET